jgi:hypothetical protein
VSVTSSSVRLRLSPRRGGSSSGFGGRFEQNFAAERETPPLSCPGKQPAAAPPGWCLQPTWFLQALLIPITGSVSCRNSVVFLRRRPRRDGTGWCGSWGRFRGCERSAAPSLKLQFPNSGPPIPLLFSIYKILFTGPAFLIIVLFRNLEISAPWANFEAKVRSLCFCARRPVYRNRIFHKAHTFFLKKHLSSSLSNPRVRSNLSSIRLKFPKSCDFVLSTGGTVPFGDVFELADWFVHLLCFREFWALLCSMNCVLIENGWFRAFSS